MPELKCDLVMKGGITSGTVYPKAIVRLAQDYRFCSIGGTSAGAIAAGAAAAAEYCRQKSQSKEEKAGFEKLAGLPEELGAKGAKGTGPKLLELFQPQPRFRQSFGFLLSLIGTDRTGKGEARSRIVSQISTWLLIGRICLKAMSRFPVFAIGGAAFACFVLWLLGVHFDWSWRMVGIAGVVFAGASVAAFYGLWYAVQALPRNGFGLCRGYEPAKKGKPEDETQLTAWLHKMIQETAGRKASGAPLTFGELKNEAGIELRAMTTNLCYGLPHRLPFGRGGPWAFFDERVWAQYFPPGVIAHMKSRPPERSRNPAEDNENDQQYAAAVRRMAGLPQLLPFPEADDFPVVVAVRMSLSFPVLLSAVPVHMLDPVEHEHGKANKCWFSDGGISSNFPLHFFDSSIPGRPTFAINLQEVDPGVKDENRVDLPKTNKDGLKRSWKGIEESDGPAALSEFLLAIFNVMQNWRDNSLLRLPGYRDRVATVRLEPHEGGLNLNMPKELIGKLAGYGEEAADRLAEHFLPTNAAKCKANNIETTWDNHRWIRLLTSLAGLEKLASELKNIRTAPTDGSLSYGDLLDPGKTTNPPSYIKFTAEQRKFALKSLDDVQKALEDCRTLMSGVPSMEKNTPRPFMHFRLTQET